MDFSEDELWNFVYKVGPMLGILCCFFYLLRRCLLNFTLTPWLSVAPAAVCRFDLVFALSREPSPVVSYAISSPWVASVKLAWFAKERVSWWVCMLLWSSEWSRSYPFSFLSKLFDTPALSLIFWPVALDFIFLSYGFDSCCKKW